MSLATSADTISGIGSVIVYGAEIGRNKEGIWAIKALNINGQLFEVIA